MAGDDGLGFDLDRAVSEVAGSLDLGSTHQEPDVEVDDAAEVDEGIDTPTPAPINGADPAVTVPAVKPPPKSWAREQHERWSKLDPDTQSYIETREKQFLDGIEQYKGDAGYGKAVRDAFAPYEQVIAAAGLDAPRAVQYLMNAHYRLTQGTPDQRRAAYEKLGADLGLTKAAGGVELPPELKALTEKVTGIESALTARQQAEYNEARERTAKEVESFASDEKHPYFDECAADIVVFIQAGLSLPEAYEKAVYANPVTRAKEVARLQTEAQAALTTKAEKEVAEARKATGGNVRSADTRKAPTEPKGSMDDTMRETYRKIQNRAH